MRAPKGRLGGLARVLAALLAFSAVASATTYRQLSLDELFGRAEIAFFGTVSEVASENRDGEPYTVVTFAVTNALGRGTGEGDAPGEQTVQLALYGGTLPNGRTVSVEGMPEFGLGDEVLVFAYDAPYYSPIVGFSQGLWRSTPAGLTDEVGRVLSLSSAGTLSRDADNTDVQAVLSAVQTRLEGAR